MNHASLAFEQVHLLLLGKTVEHRLTVTRGQSLVDGVKATAAMWGSLNMSGAWEDAGPSPAGNPGPYLKAPHHEGDTHHGEGCVHRVYSRLQVGDLLWGREAWAITTGRVPGDLGAVIRYSADSAMRSVTMPAEKPWPLGLSWTLRRSAAQMPRWASRWLLRVARIGAEPWPDKDRSSHRIWVWLYELEAVEQEVSRAGG